jgi:hypothetical protein
MIEPEHPGLPIVRQCELLGLARASYYHQPEPETDRNLQLMRVIDETYLAYPVFGGGGTAYLKLDNGTTAWFDIVGGGVGLGGKGASIQTGEVWGVYYPSDYAR